MDVVSQADRANGPARSALLSRATLARLGSRGVESLGKATLADKLQFEAADQLIQEIVDLVDDTDERVGSRFGGFLLYVGSVDFVIGAFIGRIGRIGRILDLLVQVADEFAF